jgi:hypothetical protein
MTHPEDPLVRRLRADADRWRAAHPAPDVAARVLARLDRGRAPRPALPWRRRLALAAAASALLAFGAWLARAGDAPRPVTEVAGLTPLPELGMLVSASTDYALELVDAPVMSEYEALAADASAAAGGLFARFTAPIVSLADAR